MKDKSQSQIDFTKGYTCAVAALVNMHGHTREAEDLYSSNYHSVDELRAMGVEESDIETILPVIAEIERRRGYKN